MVPEATLQALGADLAGLDLVWAEPLLSQLSHDQFAYSPLLAQRLQHCVAQLVVRVHQREELIRVAAQCYRHQVPLTLRGAGTGNYGQCVPLEGGLVLDCSGLDQVRHFDPASGVLTAEPGCRLLELDRFLQPQGWALRLSPSTWRSASLGGYIAGGSSGVGSLRWGLLRDRGNLLGLELVSLEAEPRLLQLGPIEAQAHNHAYGTNGIFTAVTVPTAPWQDWQELVLELPDRPTALALGEELSAAALEIDELCYLERRLLERMPDLAGAPAVAGDRLLLLASPAAVPLIEPLSRAAGGQLLWQRPQWPPRGLLLRELCWNHTTLQLRAHDPNFTYQVVLLPEPATAFIEALEARWPGWLHWHLERIRQGGRPRWVGLPLFRWQGEAQLEQLNSAFRQAGGLLFNSHVLSVEAGGSGEVAADQLAAKANYDPCGLLNPGKLRA
ncbi:MAG: FAD-binding oxidoreductase [Synechococcus lacustris]|jgi:FAD/FMN-containing dehydrogenase